jgi:hypothetical protein
MSEYLSTDNILPLIHTIRGQRVILASDLAKLYGVQAKRLNEAVKRNKVRFPSDFKFRPYAFTQRGAIMAANVLNSRQPGHECLYSQQREVLAANDAILKRLAEIDQTLMVHDEVLRDIYQKLLPHLQPPPDPPKPKIGFREKSPRYGTRRIRV